MAKGELGILRLPWSPGWVLNMGLHSGMKLVILGWEGKEEERGL